MFGVGWKSSPLIAGAVLLTSSLWGTGCGDRPTDPDLEGESQAAATAQAGGVAAKILSISGPGGVSSPSLPEGTFLGPGGHVEPGQHLRTLKGTLAELEVETGGRLYMNEDTALALPGEDHPTAVALERGELVVTAGKPADPHLFVTSENDTLEVQSGEAQVRARGASRTYAVVHGRAELRSGGQTLTLGAGESIETPLPEAPSDPVEPTLSLRPLEDTGWARTFDAAAAMADAVPRGVGSLTARRAGTQTEKQQLRLTEHRVSVNIDGRIAHTEIEQEFFNDRGVVLEGIYRFPIPEDGSVSGLSLLVGNNWMDGEIVEKQRARRIFKQIVDATVPRDPALLEWERGNVFKLRIFPIPGNGGRKVKLSYTQVLPVVGGKLRYRYPMGGTGAAGTPIDKFAFTVRIDGSDLGPEQLENITTPMLALERQNTSDPSIVELHTEREAFLPTFDLGLDVPVPEAQRQVHASSFLDRDGQAYFMVAMQPQFELGTDDRPVHYAFVLDRSHSTSPELWTTARGVVDAMTELMDEDDRFTVLACDSACEQHAAGLQQPSSEAVASAQRFLDAQDLAGGSDLAGSLLEADAALSRAGGGAQKVIVYLGDGTPTSGEMAPDGITDLLRIPLADTRVLAVALGSRSDLTALQAVVDVTAGDLVQADARDDLRTLVRELRLRAQVPALRDPVLDLPPGMVMARMQNVSAIRPGDTVLVTGKLHHRVSGDITLRGRGPAGPVRVSYPVDLTATGGHEAQVSAHLPRTWAKMQIQHLTKTQGFRAKDEIVALSTDYNVLSRHTALLVLENDEMFREFNVVRNAKNTAKWTGKLDPNTEDEKTSDASIASALARKKETKEAGRTDEESPAGGSPAKPEFFKNEGLDHAGAIAPRGSSAASGSERQQAEAEPAPEPEPAPDAVPQKKPGATRPPTVPTESLPDTAARHSGARSGPADKADKKRNFDDELDDDVHGEDLIDAEDGDGFDEMGAHGTGRGGGGYGKDAAPKAEPAPAPAPRRSRSKSSVKKKKRKMPSRPQEPMDDDPLAGLTGGGSSKSGSWNGRDGRRHSRRWREPSLRVRALPSPSSSALARVEALSAALQRTPTDRATHGRLVRSALASGHAQTLAFAQAWAQVDPDHGRALQSLADALASTGDPIALRAYESVVEVNPFSTREHQLLARAFENKGDLARACSHRRAVVSIDPASASNQAGLIVCLRRAGRTTEAAATEAAFLGSAPVSGGRRRSSPAAALRTALAAAEREHAPSRSAQLRATLTWTGSDDLDIAIVDRKGRRLSTLHGKSGVRVAESRGREELSLATVRGAIFVEVTRNRRPGDAGETRESSTPIVATLELRTPGGGRRSIPVTINAPGSQRAAKVFWSR